MYSSTLLYIVVVIYLLMLLQLVIMHCPFNSLNKPTLWLLWWLWFTLLLHWPIVVVGVSVVGPPIVVDVITVVAGWLIYFGARCTGGRLLTIAFRLLRMVLLITLVTLAACLDLWWSLLLLTLLVTLLLTPELLLYPCWFDRRCYIVGVDGVTYCCAAWYCWLIADTPRWRYLTDVVVVIVDYVVAIDVDLLLWRCLTIVIVAPYSLMMPDVIYLLLWTIKG